MSVAKVLDWLESLEPPKGSGLSDEGAKAALQAALHPITEFLKTNPTPQCRFRRATMVASRTVFTAPLEWVALLLAGGCQVTLKRPAEALTIWDEWVKTAHALPLHVTTERTQIADAELLVAMGSDETIKL